MSKDKDLIKPEDLETLKSVKDSENRIIETASLIRDTLLEHDFLIEVKHTIATEKAEYLVWRRYAGKFEVLYYADEFTGDMPIESLDKDELRRVEKHLPKLWEEIMKKAKAIVRDSEEE